MKKFFSRPKPPSDIETGNLDCKEKKLGSKKRVIDFNKLKKAPRPTKMQESIDSRNLVDGDTATLQMIVENTAGKNQTGGSKNTTLSYEKSMRGGFNLGDQSMELGSTKRVIDLNILKKVFEERRLKSQGSVDTTVMQVPEPRNPQKGWFGFGFTNSKKSKEQSLLGSS